MNYAIRVPSRLYPREAFDVFIATLPLASVPLSGHEAMFVLQGGVSKQVAASAVIGQGGGGGGTPATPNIVTTGGTFNLTAANLGDILVDVNAAVTVQLPAASTRSGFSASVVDIGGFADVQNITILPHGAETIIGQASLTISVAYGGYTLWPIPTGGWYEK